MISLDISSVDDWMDWQIKKAGQCVPVPQAIPQEDPLAELKCFFSDPVVPHHECVDLITWWGVGVPYSTPVWLGTEYEDMVCYDYVMTTNINYYSRGKIMWAHMICLVITVLELGQAHTPA